MAQRARATMIPFRLEFLHDSRPYVWTGHAENAAAAEAEARKALFAGQPFVSAAAARLVRLVQGAIP